MKLNSKNQRLDHHPLPSTPPPKPDSILFYEVLPKNSAAGAPTVDVTILFKNTQMVARSRQNKALLDANMRAGIQRDLASKALLAARDLRVVPAVGAGGGAGVGAALDPSYGALDELTAMMAAAAAANATANATAAAKSGAAGAAVGVGGGVAATAIAALLALVAL